MSHSLVISGCNAADPAALTIKMFRAVPQRIYLAPADQRWRPGRGPLSALGAVRLGLLWFAHPAHDHRKAFGAAALFLGGFYLEYIPGSPWYFPGWQILACIAWAYLLDALAVAAGSSRFKPQLLLAGIRTTGLLLVMLQIILLAAVTWQMRQQQSLIEDHHRREIGRWLRNKAAPTDRVYLEPLGYVGYYSGLKMLDNPGLASPEVVAIRQRGGTSHAQIIRRSSRSGWCCDRTRCRP